MNKMRELLSAGRHQLSLGRTNEAQLWLQQHPRQLTGLVELLWDEDPGVAGRAAHVLSKLPAKEMHRLNRWREELLGLFFESEQKKLRWLLAGILPQLALSRAEALRLAEGFEMLLAGCTASSSSILRTMALDGLAQLALGVLPERRTSVRALLEESERVGTAAMAARSRHLLKRLARAESE